jgi:hypothetical protein
VVQVKFTALVMPSVTYRITNTPELAAASEHAVKDEGLIALLKQSTKKPRSAKKKAAAAAATAAAAAAAAGTAPAAATAPASQ